jgi:uncharacterized protein YuzE
MNFIFYPDSDALYVEFSRRPYARGEELDEDRVIHYDSNDEPIGVKFLSISEGVSLRDVPRADEIGRVLDQYKKIPVYA